MTRNARKTITKIATSQPSSPGITRETTNTITKITKIIITTTGATSQRGLADTLTDPDAAFAISVPKYVPDLPQDNYDTERQVLENSLALWRTDQQMGLTNPAAWEATQSILIEAGLMDKPLDDLAACYDMDFLPTQ